MSLRELSMKYTIAAETHRLKAVSNGGFICARWQQSLRNVFWVEIWLVDQELVVFNCEPCSKFFLCSTHYTLSVHAPLDEYSIKRSSLMSMKSPYRFFLKLA